MRLKRPTLFDTILDRFRNPQLQLTIVVAVMAYCVILLSLQYQERRYAEPIQPVLEVPTQVKRLANKVEVGLHINNFPEFSFHKNKFILDALVWFKFPVGTESLASIQEFSFQNGQIRHRSLPIIKVVDDVVLISFQTTVEFKSHLNYTLYPMSDHRLRIILENRRATPNEITFESNVNNFALSDDLLTSTWTPKKKIVQAGFIKSLLHERDDSLHINYPCVVFTLEFANESMRDLISLYIPLFILFFIGFFSLLINIRDDSLRTSILTGAMPTLVLFRLVIDNAGPQASNITKVDYLYYILVSLSLLILLFQVYILLVKRKISNLPEKEQETRLYRLEFWNSGIFIVVIIALLYSVTYTHLL